MDGPPGGPFAVTQVGGGSDRRWCAYRVVGGQVAFALARGWPGLLGAANGSSERPHPDWAAKRG